MLGNIEEVVIQTRNSAEAAMSHAEKLDAFIERRRHADEELRRFH